VSYSCRVEAAETLEVILRTVCTGGRWGTSWIDEAGREYYFEEGKPQKDGAITGSIYREVEVGSGRFRRSGSIRIGPDGYLERGPGRWREAAVARHRELDHDYQRWGAARYPSPLLKSMQG